MGAEGLDTTGPGYLGADPVLDTEGASLVWQLNVKPGLAFQIVDGA